MSYVGFAKCVLRLRGKLKAGGDVSVLSQCQSIGGRTRPWSMIPVHKADGSRERLEPLRLLRCSRTSSTIACLLVLSVMCY